MSKQSKKIPDGRYVYLSSFPKKIGGGIPACEGRQDFHPKVKANVVALSELSLGEKVILVGTYSVGKSCLLRRFVDDQFTDGYKATIGVDFMYQRFKVLDVDFTLHIWDTAGQEKFRCISRTYFRGAGAVILAFDLGREETLESIHEWLEDVKKENAAPFLVFLVGLKSDMFHAVDNETGQRMASQFNAEYWECSSKTNENVKELFQRIAACLFESCAMRQIDKGNLGGTSQPVVANSISIQPIAQAEANGAEPTTQKRKLCCN